MATSQIIFLIALGVLPSAIWLWFYLRKDLHPEPKKLLTLVFLGGAIITVPIALLEQNLANSIGQGSLLFLSAAGLEEFGKLLVVWALILLWKNAAFDEPIDAMIYLITAALGFAAAENVANLFNLGSGGLDIYLGLMSARFLGATLLHTLASGVLGFYLARYYFFSRLKGASRHYLWITGLTAATLIHGLFNIFIQQAQAQADLFSLLFVVILLTIGTFVILRDFKVLARSVKISRSGRAFNSY